MKRRLAFSLGLSAMIVMLALSSHQLINFWRSSGYDISFCKSNSIICSNGHSPRQICGFEIIPGVLRVEVTKSAPFLLAAHSFQDAYDTLPPNFVDSP